MPTLAPSAPANQTLVPQTPRRPSAVSQVLRAIRADVEERAEKWDLSGADDSTVPFRIRVASDRDSRRRAYGLAYRVYRECGYLPENASHLAVFPHDAGPQTLTLLVEDGLGRDAATVSLVFDSPAGIPSDEIYGTELAALRAEGRRLVEVTRLAIDAAHTRSKTLLVRLFNFIYIFARRVRNCDDFIAAVNPRHVGYYQRLLLFEALGPQRPCPRVQGALAVLLRLDLSVPEREIQRLAGEGPLSRERTLYPCSYHREEEQAVAEFLERQQRPMSEAEQVHFGLALPLEPCLLQAVAGSAEGASW